MTREDESAAELAVAACIALPAVVVAAIWLGAVVDGWPDLKAIGTAYLLMLGTWVSLKAALLLVRRVRRHRRRVRAAESFLSALDQYGAGHVAVRPPGDERGGR